MNLKNFIYVLIIGFIFQCSGDNSTWIWKINGKKYTVNNFDDAYENYITLMAQQLQLSPEQLKSMVKNPEKSGLPEENIEMLKRLSKDNFPDQYKQLLLLNTEAEKKGFLKKKEIKSRLRFIEQFYIANLYLTEKSDAKNIEISDEEALKAWEMIRNSNPQARGIPLDKGLAATKQRLAMKKGFEKQQEFLKDILDTNPVQANPDFKLRDYVKSEMEKEDQAGDQKDSKEKK
ncbi:MAG: hypothetical protein OEV66_06450 [Spirochaetia bacterium]|nr:hypothetical protein [Spirochaetia bacterium]